MITFSRRGLHGQVVDSIGRRIVQGELAPGDVVDVDGLESDLDVSRTVVREAIKVLTAKGLVDARPRLGTYVRPRSQWNLLDADVMGWRSSDEPDVRLFRELDEVRQVFEPNGARLAAQRRTLEDLEAIGAAFEAMRGTAGENLEGHIAADLAFHRAVLAATQNELLTRFEVVMEPALRARDTLAFNAHHQDTASLEAHAAVLAAIERSDPDAAEAAMQALLVGAALDTREILDGRAKSRDAAAQRRAAAS